MFSTMINILMRHRIIHDHFTQMKTSSLWKGKDNKFIKQFSSNLCEKTSVGSLDIRSLRLSMSYVHGVF